MRRFTFRLETVLRHRETLETLREQEFANAQGNWQTLKIRLAGLQDDFAHVVAGRPGKAGEPFDARLIFDRERYLQTLQAAIEQQNRRVEAAQIVAEETRQAMLVARQAREAVTQLHDKDLVLHTEQAQKQDQETLDELATLRYVRADMQKAA